MSLYILFFVALLFGVPISIYNGIIQRFNVVKQSWADIMTQQRQKEQTLPKLIDLLNEHREFEEEVLTKVTKLRSAIKQLDKSEDFDINVIKDVQDKSKDVINGINAIFEAYPKLKSTSLYTQVMIEISEQEENVAASIKIFNSNVQSYNTGIEIFPNALVNNLLLKKERINEFTDSDAVQTFEYKPNF